MSAAARVGPEPSTSALLVSGTPLGSVGAPTAAPVEAGRWALKGAAPAAAEPGGRAPPCGTCRAVVRRSPLMVVVVRIEEAGVLAVVPGALVCMAKNRVGLANAHEPGRRVRVGWVMVRVMALGEDVEGSFCLSYVRLGSRKGSGM